jgi:hypothetical protein
MDDFDAFIDYVDTTDEPGEVTVSGVDSDIRYQGKDPIGKLVAQLERSQHYHRQHRIVIVLGSSGAALK